MRVVQLPHAAPTHSSSSSTTHNPSSSHQDQHHQQRQQHRRGGSSSRENPGSTTSPSKPLPGLVGGSLSRTSSAVPAGEGAHDRSSTTEGTGRRRGSLPEELWHRRCLGGLLGCVPLCAHTMELKCPFVSCIRFPAQPCVSLCVCAGLTHRARFDDGTTINTSINQVRLAVPGWFPFFQSASLVAHICGICSPSNTNPTTTVRLYIKIACMLTSLPTGIPS